MVVHLSKSVQGRPRYHTLKLGGRQPPSKCTFFLMVRPVLVLTGGSTGSSGWGADAGSSIGTVDGVDGFEISDVFDVFGVFGFLGDLKDLETDEMGWETSKSLSKSSQPRFFRGSHVFSCGG